MMATASPPLNLGLLLNALPYDKSDPMSVALADIYRAKTLLDLSGLESFSFGFMNGGSGFIQVNADDKTDELLATGRAERYTASDGLPRGRFKLGDIRVIWIDMRAQEPGEGERTCD